jgi:tetratricopeptide (TPR) repeat protein
VWAVGLAVTLSGLGYAYHIDRRNKALLAYMDQAHHGEHCGTLDVAERAYQNALRLDATYLAARQGLAELYAMEGRTEKALKEHRRAIALDPRNPEAHIGLAQALMQQRRYPEAIRRLEQAVKAAPRHAYMHQLLATCYRRGGQLGKAKAELAELQRLDPDSTAARAGLSAIARHQARRHEYHRAHPPKGCCA